MRNSAQMAILRLIASIGFSLTLWSMLGASELEASLMSGFVYLLFSTIAEPLKD